MRLSLRLALLCLLAACGGDKQAAPAPEAAKVAPVTQPIAAPAVPQPTGRIEGVIVLAERATLPKLEDPKKAAKLVVTNPPAPCSPFGERDLTPVQKDAASGGLSSIHVALTGMASTAPVAPRIHELRLDDCRLTPTLLGARVGDSVRITNISEVPLLPSLMGDKFMEAIMAKQSRIVELKQPGASRIACNFGSYCGQTDVLVTTHSLYAVTDGAGRFRIDNVPLDRALTVHAWHPLFDEASETVTLTKDAAARTVKLALKPVPSEPAVVQPVAPAANDKAKQPRKKAVVLE